MTSSEDHPMASMLTHPIVLVLVASLLGATGQYLVQTGARAAEPGLLAFLRSPWVVAGVACYVTVMGLFTLAFKAGGTVRVLYPVYAITFVWGAVIAALFYRDPIRPVHVVGMSLLVGGIALMTR